MQKKGVSGESPSPPLKKAITNTRKRRILGQADVPTSVPPQLLELVQTSLANPRNAESLANLCASASDGLRAFPGIDENAWALLVHLGMDCIMRRGLLDRVTSGNGTKSRLDAPEWDGVVQVAGGLPEPVYKNMQFIATQFEGGPK